jgi:hypothetical protein
MAGAIAAVVDLATVAAVVLGAGLADRVVDMGASVLALTEDSQIVETVRVCADEDAGMHLAVS